MSVFNRSLTTGVPVSAPVRVSSGGLKLNSLKSPTTAIRASGTAARALSIKALTIAAWRVRLSAPPLIGGWIAPNNEVLPPLDVK